VNAPERSTRARLILATLVLVALLVRVAAVVHLRSWRSPNPAEHRSIALGLLSGHGFSFGAFGYYGPSSVQSPAYPLLLAGLFEVFGADSAGAYAAAMVINAAMGAVGVWLAYVLVRTLGGDRRTGLVAAGALAVWPSQIYAVTSAQAIVFITVAMMAIVVLFYRGVRSGSVGVWVAFSIIGALAALTEPVVLPLMMLSGVLVLTWRSPLSWGARARNAAILLAAGVAIIGPWSVRNRMVHGKWVPIKSTFWVNVWKGNNDRATGTDRPAISQEQEHRLSAQTWSLSDSGTRDPAMDSLRQYHLLSEQDQQRLIGRTEAEREMIFKEWAGGWIRSHPKRYAQLCLTRLGKTLWIDWDNPKSHNALYTASRAVLLTLSGVGLVVALRRRWALVYPALLIGSCLLTYTLTITAARFSMTFEPFQLCLAAALVSAVMGIWWPAEGRAGTALQAAPSGVAQA
jgi:hypothetical protein